MQLREFRARVLGAAKWHVGMSKYLLIETVPASICKASEQAMEMQL
jgi:hypothetical protein